MISMNSFLDELEKISGEVKTAQLSAAGVGGRKLLELLKSPGGAKYKKLLAYGGVGTAGAGAALTGEQAYRDWDLGRRIRQQQGG